MGVRVKWRRKKRRRRRSEALDVLCFLRIKGLVTPICQFPWNDVEIRSVSFVSIMGRAICMRIQM